jgi:hypothetical protein
MTIALIGAMMIVVMAEVAKYAENNLESSLMIYL